MKTSRSNLLILLLIIFCVLITSCNSNIKQANNLKPETNAPKSAFSNKIKEEFSKQLNVIVYDNYIGP
ncbi:hypothetical protein Bccel_0463 [Pseudobacteroides cellulosolvens ATCC 35603 = DSM 2933]|uniref:Uncharacterized protein n=1 Tax=Pseudobacteroides cellulosolvens ATCC 35603 = DSM 2933 TaxID=398512 RepID=A0A0L6JHA1_9FIRM|nr:hypothetical protein Bccel_0463 [Pseudobacteroides cellulosolvens ATCC 35603 = DSM 2933]